METKDIFNILAIIDDPDNTLKFDKTEVTQTIFINCDDVTSCGNCKLKQYCRISCIEVTAYLQDNHLRPELFL